MADEKKYYYLKLKDDFFDSDAMIVLESMPDGYLYSNILLKLYLRSLKYKGKLMFNDRIPYNPTVLAKVTRHNVGVMEKALSVFTELGLIEVLDNGAIYMLDIQNFIGTSSTEADRKRAYREKIEQEKRQMSGQMSLNCPDKSPPEIKIEIKKELDIDTTTKAEAVEEAPHEKIVEMYNKICISFNPVKQITNKRKGNMNARYRESGKNIEVFKDIFTKMQNSQFLKNGWSSGGKADFDWVMKPTNFTKVLEGKYSHEGGEQVGKFGNRIQFTPKKRNEEDSGEQIKFKPGEEPF